MTQDYITIDIDDDIKDTPERLIKNFNTILTSNSGANAPSSPEEGNLWLKVGTPSILHVYKNGAWVEILDASDIGKQNQNSRLDAISNAPITSPTNHIPVYSSDSDVVFKGAGTSGLSILQSASAAGATFVNQSSLDASTAKRGLVGLAKTTGIIDSSDVRYTDTVVDGDGVVTVGHLNRRTFTKDIPITGEDMQGSLDHELGDTPRWVRLVAVCTDDSLGYTDGSEVEISWGVTSGMIPIIYANSLQVKYRIDSGVFPGSGLLIFTNQSPARRDINNVNFINNWKLKVYAGI